MGLKCGNQENVIVFLKHRRYDAKNKNNYKFIFPGGKRIYRRQDCPKAYQASGMVYAFTSKHLFKIKSILPEKKTACVIVDRKEAVNIDNIIDYKLAKALSKKI